MASSVPSNEAHSNKDTFIDPENDPAIPTTTQEAADRKEDGQDDAVQAREADDHEASDSTMEELNRLRLMQTKQQDPDKFQKDIHQPTTEDVLAAPMSKPKTIDPMTGQIHYVSDAAQLNGGTAANEGD